MLDGESVAEEGWLAPPAAAHAAPPVHVYTDGSFDAVAPAQHGSSWAVLVGDAWLRDCFQQIPDDEKQVLPSHAAGAVLYGAAVSCTRGIYAAELQAIARALALLPSSLTLHVHSDSKGALAGVQAYERESNARQRLRMAARPLLQLIFFLIVWHLHPQSDVTRVQPQGVSPRALNGRASELGEPGGTGRAAGAGLRERRARRAAGGVQSAGAGWRLEEGSGGRGREWWGR